MMFGKSRSHRKRSSQRSSRAPVAEHAPKVPVDWLTWIGILIFLVIFVGGLHPTKYIVDGLVRSYVWALCALFAVWGLVVWFLGKWDVKDSRPALWLFAMLGAFIVIGGLQLIPLPASLVSSLSPAQREIQDSFATVGLSFPQKVAFATAPEKGFSSWNQLIAMTCFFVGVTVLGARRQGAIAMITAVIAFSFIEGIIGVMRFTFTGAGRSSGIVYNPNHHAASVIMGLPLALAAISYARTTSWGRMRAQVQSRNDLFMMLTVVAGIAGIGWLLSMSRGSLISGACVLAAWWVTEAFMNYKEYSRMHRISFWDWFRGLPLLPILIPCICLVLLLFSAAYLPKIVTRFTNPDQHLTGRMELWEASWKGLAATNYLGLGLGGTEYALNRYVQGNTTRYAPIQSHNDYVQTVAELGVLAGLLGAVCILFCARALWQQEKDLALKQSWSKRLPRRAIFVGVLITLIHSFFDFHLRVPMVCLEFLTLLALLMNVGGSEPLTDHTGRYKMRHRKADDAPSLLPAGSEKSEHLANHVAFGLIETV
ncbi:O-antigen ligase family protein [Candidatus Sumerlaeota bacterium]|nr:O-antigen ligase family protein [Candidatus Sumerlaeota bacterium]